MIYRALWQSSTPQKAFFIFIFCALCSNFVYFSYAYRSLTRDAYVARDAKLIGVKEHISHANTIYFTNRYISGPYRFWTYSPHNDRRSIGHYFHVVMSTGSIDFIGVLKGFYARGAEVEPIEKRDEPQETIKDFISKQHESEYAKELYENLFLNTDVSETSDDFISVYGLGAFFAISGLNVALIGGILFAISTPLFRLFQDRYFPYVNRTVWISGFLLALLGVYAYLTDFTPSFLRAYGAAIIVLYLSLNGFRIGVYRTFMLGVIALMCMYIPLIFSLGFWLSVYGVFLILLFIQQFICKRLWVEYIALNTWLFVAMMPIIHGLFPLYTSAHLFNPIFAALFDVAYPFSLFLHMFGAGGYFDFLLDSAVASKDSLVRYSLTTPVWFVAAAIVLSIVAAFNRRGWILYNGVLTSYFVSALLFMYSFSR